MWWHNKVEACHAWAPEKGHWWVEMWSGLMGTFHVGMDGEELSTCWQFVRAPAVVDDFGDLVLVGRWA